MVYSLIGKRIYMKKYVMKFIVYCRNIKNKMINYILDYRKIFISRNKF